jgi:hypothetical protein
MTVAVRVIPYKNRLAKLIQAPGGKRVADALADARANLDKIADLCLGEIDAAIAGIQAAAGAAERTPESFEVVYVASNNMIGLAGLFGREDLGKAAHSLCELLDRAGGWDRCPPVALKVHVDSLVLLRHPDVLSSAQLGDILDGLAKVVQRTAHTEDQ